MHGQFLEVGLLLALIGSVLASMSAFVVGRKAFKINLLWGVACLILPFATLILPFFSWRQLRGLFVMQLVGMMLLLAGIGVVMMDPDTRSGLKAAMGERAQIAALEDEDPDGVPPPAGVPDIAGILQGRLWSSEAEPKRPAQPAATPHPPASKPVPPKPEPPKPDAATHPIADQKERALRELYVAVQTAYGELEKKRPAAGAKPEEIHAFNQQSISYNALLDRYKAAVVESKKLRPK